jgi:hypothetical protein
MQKSSLFILSARIGYNTSFYYSPEFSISAFHYIYSEAPDQVHIGISISPLLFKFPIKENISILLDFLIQQFDYQKSPVISNQKHTVELSNFSLGIAYKL